MKVLSLFSGVGGFDMGLENAGMETVFQCEWDRHCNAILQHKWPNVPKWEDVSTLTGAHVLANAPVVDVVAWGSPCQDLSVAGQRGGLGLDGGRSNLFHEGIRIIKELRKESDGLYPRYSIWENVPGALTSNRGEDFKIILSEMVEAGAVGLEWRILDAQFFGVPQRRRRLFVVAVFDSTSTVGGAREVFPLCASLPRDSKKGAKQGQDTSTATEGSVGDGSLPFNASSHAGYVEGIGTLRANGGDLGGGSETIVVGLQGNMIGRADKNGPAGKGYTDEGDPMFTLNTTDRHAVVFPINDKATRHKGKRRVGNTHKQDGAGNGLGIGNPDDPMYTLTQGDRHAIAFSHTQGLDAQPSDVAFPTLRMNGGGHAVAQETLMIDGRRNNDVRIYNEPVQTLEARMGTGGNNVPMLQQAYKVRKLTPVECERLMGWPDNHTLHKADGTLAADTHRYKQCGNGVASPVAEWIGKQLLGPNDR